MKKNILFLLLFSLLIFACSKEEEPQKSNNNGNGTPAVSLEDTLSRAWTVTNALHNGSADNSSKGLKLDIRKDGSYTLTSTGFIGTWEFQNDKKEVLLDKDNAQFKTTWTIQEMSSTFLKVSFKSPFTGGSAVWEMTAD